MRSPKFALLIVLGMAFGAIGTGSAIRAQQTPAPVCTFPGNLRYSPGAYAQHQGQMYGCFYVYAEELKPIGVAWVKLTADTTFTPTNRR